MLTEFLLKLLLVIGSAILGYLVYSAFKFVKKMKQIGDAVNKFPMDERHWLYGHMHMIPDIGEGCLKFYRDRCQRFPRVCAFWGGNWFLPNVTVQHPETVRLIMKSSEPKPVKLGVYRYGRPLVGDGLLFSSGAKWLRNRKLLTNVFHFNMLREYLTTKNERTDVFLDILKASTARGESVEMYSKVSHLSFDIILRCSFSYEADVQEIGKTHPYVKAVDEAEELWTKRCFRPWQHFDFIYRFTEDHKRMMENSKYMHDISEGIIKKRKDFLKINTDDIKKDFLDVLLTARDENGVGLTDMEIRDEVDTFLIAGYGTTASAISWIFYELAKHPHHQSLCQKEVDNLLEGRPNDHLGWDDLHNLPYLTMCIKEALRMDCPIFLMERELENPMVIEGVEVPAGTLVSANIYGLHHNPQVWKEPTKYDPERFSEENLASIDHFAFVPFSAGPRNCIGQNFAMDEIKLVVARTLRRFTLSEDPKHETRPKLSLVLKTEDGMHLKVSER